MMNRTKQNQSVHNINKNYIYNRKINKIIIIIIANLLFFLQTKCHQYWPSSGSISYNDFTITMVDQQVLAYYTIRTFVLNMVS